MFLFVGHKKGNDDGKEYTDRIEDVNRNCLDRNMENPSLTMKKPYDTMKVTYISDSCVRDTQTLAGSNEVLKNERFAMSKAKTQTCQGRHGKGFLCSKGENHTFFQQCYP